MATISFTEPREPKLAEVPQTDFLDDWVGLTVGEEISRGSRLRDLKSLAPKEVDKYSKLVGVNNTANPHCPDKTVRKKSRRTRPASLSRAQPNRGASTSERDAGGSRCSSPSFRTTKLKKSNKCPLRIAELAAPTKRQCMATFRSIGHRLPDVMVDRLKIYITDQEPVAKVNDAVECYKRHKGLKGNSQKSKRSSDTSHKKDCKESKKTKDLRNMCLQFSRKIALNLSNPLQITLVPELKRLSDVISYEIDILFSSHRMPLTYYEAASNKKMQREVSAKVSVWISTILEEVSTRMMEEQVRANKAKEEANKIIVNLLQDKVSQQKTAEEKADSQKQTDLEEEEGPVLDVLDSIVENALDLCFPEVQSNEESSSATTVVSLVVDTQELYEATNFQAEEDQSHDEEQLQHEDQLQVEEQLQGQEQKDVASIKDGLDIEQDISQNVENESQSEEKQDIAEDIEKVGDIVQDNNEAADGEVLEPSADEVIESKEDAPINTDAVDEEVFNNDHENVSDDFPDVDEKRKVAFVRDAYRRGDSIDTNGDNESRINVEMFMEKLNNPPQPIAYPKPDVDLAVANQHLLSDADESWPEEPSARMKRMASVVKSVTSLGMIVEKMGRSHIMTKEEANEALLAEESIDNITDLEKSYTKISEDTGNVLVLLDTEKPNTEEQICDNLELYPLGQALSSTVSTRLSSYPLEEIDEYHLLFDASTAIDVEENKEPIASDEKEEAPATIANLSDIREETIAITAVKLKEENDNGKGDNNDLDSEKNIIFEAIRQKMAETAKKPKFDYKVYPNTAPAWALRNNSSDETIVSLGPKRKLTQCELRKWCQDLERTVNNMQQWYNWMDGTCKKMIQLRQTTAEANKVFTPNKKKVEMKEWSKFKKDLDKEAVLWTKLNYRTLEALKAYTACSQNVKPKQKVNSTLFCNRDNTMALFEMMNDFDTQSWLLHRMIVSNEYCARCNCKNYSKSSNVEPVTCCKAGPKVSQRSGKMVVKHVKLPCMCV